MTYQAKKFLRRHVTVQAIQFTGKNHFQIQAFINGRDPDLKTDYAKQKWEEYCEECEKAGGIRIPSSLGYDPTYTLALASDYVLSPEVGVFTVMGKESFEAQYMAPEEITDVSGVNALAEGYGPLDFGRYQEKIVSEPDATTFAGGQLFSDQRADDPQRPDPHAVDPADFKPETKTLMSQPAFDMLVDDLIKETERAISQRDAFKASGTSTAGHGGSHDTCFGEILRRYIYPTEKKIFDSLNVMLSFANTMAAMKKSIDGLVSVVEDYERTEVMGNYGLDLVEFVKLSPALRQTLLREAGVLQSLKNTTQSDPLMQKTLDEVVQSRKSDFPVGRNVFLRPEVNLTGAKFEKIVLREELDALMKEPGRFEADTAFLRGHTVNWHALVAGGNGVYGVLGELVGFRRRDKDSVWADIAFPIGQDDQAVIVLKDISAVFLGAESAQDFNGREIILCRPTEAERIIELMNAQVNRAQGTTPKLVEAPSNVTPLFDQGDAQARPNHSVWTLDDLGKLSADITRLLIPSLAGVENGKTYRFTLWLNRSGSAVNLRSLFEPAHSEEPVRDELDRAGEIIRSFIGRQFPMTVTGDTADAIATHRHYKGGLYYRLFEALHTEDEEDLTIYLHVWPNPPGAYARPVEMFNGKNDNGAERFTAL